MSEDKNKLQSIIGALKDNYKGELSTPDVEEYKGEDQIHEQCDSNTNSNDIVLDEDQEEINAEEDKSGKDIGSFISTSSSQPQKEEYDPLQELNRAEETDDDVQSEKIGNSFKGEDSVDGCNEDDGDSAEERSQENNEKENDEDVKNKNDEKNDSSSLGTVYEDSSKLQETGLCRSKDQNSTKADDIDHASLQVQVKYIMDSEILSMPEFKELSAQEKLVAIFTLLNSNSETAIPTKTSNPALVEAAGRRRFPPPDMSQSMNFNERQRYVEYLRGENRITEIEHFPSKSRLFIGNLPLKNVTKEDLFRIFSPYGHIFQINIKNAFGFIQYDNAQSVRDAIECESGETNFGKKLILEVSSSNSRPQFDHGDHGTNSSSTFVTSGKRPFDEQDEEDDMYSDNHYKKTKKRIPQCMILVKRTADRSYANEVFNNFRNGSDLETDMVFLKPRMELRKLINDAAYDGVWGVILVNKTRNVDIQTFYKGQQGETKFDEYISVSCEDSIAIFNNLKNVRNGNTLSSHLQHRSKLPHSRQPQQSQPVQPPQLPQQTSQLSQQQYYGVYGIQQPQQHSYMAPTQQIYGPIASVPPPQQQQQQYPSMQSYGAFAPQQIPMSAPAHSNSPMDHTQLLAAIQHLPQNVISSLLSMAQHQPNQQQQVLGLIQQLQNNPQCQQVAQQLVNNIGNPYAGYTSAPQNSSLMTGSPPPPPPSHAPQQQPIQKQKQHSVSQPQQSQTGSSVQSLLDSLAQLQK